MFVNRSHTPLGFITNNVLLIYRYGIIPFIISENHIAPFDTATLAIPASLTFFFTVPIGIVNTYPVATC